MITEKVRIAILRLSALGDIVNSAVALQIIHRHYPNAQIDWYVEEAFAPLLTGHPLLQNVIPVPIKRIKKTKNIPLFMETLKNLRAQPKYDHIIDAQGLLKSAIVTLFLNGPIHGFDRRSAREGLASWFYDTVSAIPYELNVIKRNVMVITQALGITYDENEIVFKQPLFPIQEKPESLRGEKNIACIIGASWPSKCYPKEHFLTLCQNLPYPCHLIWGSENEYNDALWIAERSMNTHVAPKMSLKELVNFIGHCDLTIGNDTGPTHMAWAMNRASITLFGPTNERMIFPTPKNISLKSSSIVNILKINRNDFSIRDIHPNHIILKAQELL